VAALPGRRGQVRTARKVPVIGLLLVVAGVGAAAVGSAMAVAFTTGLNPTNGGSTALVAGLIAGGAALAQIGLIVTSPAIVGLAGRWSRRLPLAGRLAMRDAARHRGRSAPAMAAVLTAVTGSTALLLYVAAVDAHDREMYTPSGPADSGAVQLVDYDWHRSGGGDGTTFAPADRVLDAIRPELPPFTATVVETTIECFEEPCASAAVVTPPENECFVWLLDRMPTAAEKRRADRDWRCRQTFGSSGTFPGTPVGRSEVLELATGGVSSRDAVAALQAGGVVVFDRADVLDGRARFEVVTGEEAAAAEAAGRETEVRTVELPAAYLPVEQRFAEAVYSPEAAARLGVATGPGTLQLRFVEVPSTDDEEAANAALRNAGLDVGLRVERGYTSDYGLGILALVVGAAVVTLGASGIATGLAQADARADHATLAAVGAAPRLRRTLAAAQALSIAALGTALGVAAGFVPALALIGAVESLDLVIPWLQLTEVLVGIPLLAGALAWLLTRSRVPLERRIA
jgi:putative ABC transport system permease protein